ncbi:MAG: type II toxin-antitoxin system PemK/MazF family toxin [bacterium]
MAVKKAGQIVLFEFPQTDFSSTKLRPVLLLAQLPSNYDDWLICMISTKKHQYIEGLDETINEESSDFSKSGLKAESVIRATRIAVVSGEILVGSIGEISQERLTQIKKNLAKWIRAAK